MPEERGLYPKMRALEQLIYVARLSGLDAGAALSSANLWIERFGLQERANDRVETLSLGNQQRVQLAVALVHNPDLLVLDEPFSGLDPVGVDLMSDVLKGEVAGGAAVISPATSSSSSRGSATTSPSSTTGGSSLRELWMICARRESA